jgi:hypothetical protein
MRLSGCGVGSAVTKLRQARALAPITLLSRVRASTYFVQSLLNSVLFEYFQLRYLHLEFSIYATELLKDH